MVAVIATVVIVGTGFAAENNPVSAWLHTQLGVGVWAVLTPIAVGVLFECASKIRSRKLHWAIAATLIFDAVGNLAHIAVWGLPGAPTFATMSYAPIYATIAITALVYWRPLIYRAKGRLPTPRRESVRVICVVFLVLTAIPAGSVLLYTQPISEQGSGVASAAEQEGSSFVFKADTGSLVKVDEDTGNIISSTGTGDSIYGISRAPDNETVYVSQFNGYVKAYHMSNMTLKWNVSAVPNSGESIAVSKQGKYVYVGGDDGTVKGLYAENGSQVWSRTFNPSGSSDPIPALDVGPENKRVYAAVNNGGLYALGTKTGGTQWSDTTSAGYYSVDVSAAGTVYGGGGGSYVNAFDLTGTQKWSYSTPDTNVQSVAAHKNGVVFGTDAGHVEALDKTGSRVWVSSSKHGTNNVLAAEVSQSQEVVYTGGGGSALKASYISNGTQIWSNTANTYGVEAISSGNEVADLNTIRVQVTSQSGLPIENSTVEYYGVNTKKLDSTVDDLEARSNELLDQAANPRPNSWNPDLSISDSIAADADGKYVTTHSAGDMGIAGWKASPDLAPAQLRFDRGETVYAYVWDPSKDGLVQDGVESEYPGGVDDNTGVVVEQIDHKNDTISKTVYETDETYNVGGLGGEHDYVALNLPPGYYRIYAEGDPQNAVVREVGDPASIIERDLRNEAQKYSEQAQQVRDRISNGKFARQTLTTNESGYVTITPAKGVKVIAIQAYKADGSLVDAKNPDPSALRELRASGFDGAIYLSTQPKRVNLNNFDTANDTAQVKVRKWTAAPYANMSRFQNLAEQLQSELLNATTADLESAFEDRLEQVNRDNLEQRWADLANLLRSNPNARERYLNETNRDQLPNAEDLSDTELRQSLRVAQSALATQPSTGAGGETTTEVGNGVADFTAILNGEYEPDDVAIFAHYSNGTTRTVADEYVSVDQSLTGSETEIRVRDYPVGKEDPAQVTFEVKAANQNGVDSVRGSIVNPAFGGEVPAIDAIDVSTLRPGPSETVSISLRPAKDSSYGSLKDVRVFAPDGNELNVTLDGERATFETAGQGTHTIRATYTDSTGAEFVETIRINAQEATTNPPPTVRIEDGGDTVIAGSGLRSARVEETQDGKRVTAIVPADGDRPGTVHVRGSDAFTGDVTLNVVKGDLEESIDKHVSVVVHTQLPEGALVYRDGRDQPITRDGSTQYGEVEKRTGEDGSTKHIIRTYTDASGQLKLEISRDPGFLERTLYDFRTSGVPLPSIGMLYNAVVIFDEVPTQPPAVVIETLEQPLLDEADPGEIVPGDAAAAMEVAT